MNIREKKLHLIAYKGGKCMDCGRTFPQCCYDFDHRVPSEKSFAISSKMGKPLQELMVEVDKCDLVCSNCHRIRTAGNPLISEKMSSGQKGRTPWNRGRKCPEISSRMLGNVNGTGGKGKVVSIEQKRRISETLKTRGIKPSVEACAAGGRARQVGGA